jgi:UDP-N-acetylglucosamine 1-carboxyvinyltransferase
MSKTGEQISRLIKSLRLEKGLTQKDFAILLQTSQSAIARIESGKQNLTTNEIKKISEVLGRKIISVDKSIDFRVIGGRKLNGEITTNTSKNGAMGLICASLLNRGKTILHKVPKIEEVNRILEVLESIGVNISWTNKNSLVIKVPNKLQIQKINKQSAVKIRSALMMIGPLVHRLKKFRLPHAGGCKMGERTIAAHKFGLENLGINIETKNNFYVITNTLSNNEEVVMYEAGDTAVINVILRAALMEKETLISFASSNYQVQEVCFFLKIEP